MESLRYTLYFRIHIIHTPPIYTGLFKNGLEQDLKKEDGVPFMSSDKDTQAE